MKKNHLYVKPSEFEIIKSIFKDTDGVFFFGSRVKGDHKKFSDLDVCIKRDKLVPDLELSLLREQFEESNLPYIVDIIDYQRVSEDFQKRVDETKIPIFGW